MLPDKKIKCHDAGFTKSCFDGVTKHRCPKWTRIIGADPNTGQPVDKHACADSILPMLLIENSQQQRQTGAAVESLRNQLVIAAAQNNSLLKDSLIYISEQLGELRVPGSSKLIGPTQDLAG